MKYWVIAAVVALVACIKIVPVPMPPPPPAPTVDAGPLPPEPLSSPDAPPVVYARNGKVLWGLRCAKGSDAGCVGFEVIKPLVDGGVGVAAKW